MSRDISFLCRETPHYAFVEVCTECGAELTTELLPEPVADETGMHTMGQIDVDELTEDDRAMLALILRGSDVHSN